MMSLQCFSRRCMSTANGMFLQNILNQKQKCLLAPSATGFDLNKPCKRNYYMYSAEPFHPIPNKEAEWKTAEEAISVVTSGMKVFVHGFSATPRVLLKALGEYSLQSNIKDVELLHMILETNGENPFPHEQYDGVVRSNSFFIGPNLREGVNKGYTDFVPILLSEIPLLFRRNNIELDVALIQVSPPDEHGFCTLGPSVDITRSAIQNARFIIAQVNKNMPRTFGDGVIHSSHCDALVEGDDELPDSRRKGIMGEIEEKIGALIADELVLDGATLQMGFNFTTTGSIPDAVLSKLQDHRDLGIHSEMFGDGIIDLIDKGVITNGKKAIHTGKTVASFTQGSKKIYKFIDDNPSVVLCDAHFVNKTSVVVQNPKVTSINSCIEVDLTGQVVSDSIGTYLYSGVGAQMDFIRGAALGEDGLGKPILALPSISKTGESKIVPFLKPGSGVVTTRAHVHYIVTEYGIAYLFGKNLRQRMYELIRIAHPHHREELEKAAFDILKVMPSP